MGASALSSPAATAANDAIAIEGGMRDGSRSGEPSAPPSKPGRTTAEVVSIEIATAGAEVDSDDDEYESLGAAMGLR
jgi:hypothetical protein